MVVLESQQQVEALTPDIAAMAPLGKMVCVTAPGEEYDFVSRFFCPGEGYRKIRSPDRRTAC